MPPPPSGPSDAVPAAAAAGTGEVGFRARLRGFYLRHQRRLPVASFALGFVWDASTLSRIDRMSDNLILLAYIAGLAAMIVITLRSREAPVRAHWLSAVRPHFAWAMQFLLGGLLSSYVVFYFKSVSWTQTQVFFALLVALLIGNEFLERRLENERLLAVLFTFCVFSFLAFFIPVLAGRVGRAMYSAAGLLTLAASLGLFALAIPVRTREGPRRFRVAAAWILFVWTAHVVLYLTNLIPPVPLALTDAAVYHSVERIPAGYVVSYVDASPLRFWHKSDDPFLLAPGEAAYCYTAVFAPTGVRVPIRHVWSFHEKGSGWRVTDRVGFEVTGGRDGGYRGYSRKAALRPGFWRVSVETHEGQILGHTVFEVRASGDGRRPLAQRLIR